MATEPRTADEVDHPVIQDMHTHVQRYTALGMPVWLARKLWANTYRIKIAMRSGVASIVEAHRPF